MNISNMLFNIKSTITVSLGTGDTFNISKDFELGEDIETGGETIDIVLKNRVQIERMRITATGGIVTIVERGLEQGEEIVENADLKKEWSDGDVGYITILGYDVMKRTELLQIKQEALTFATTTERDSTLGGDGVCTINYTDVKCTDTGLFYNYNTSTGQWEVQGTGTATPNASQTVAGSVEIATDSEITAGTGIGGTGATLSVTPTQLKKSISLKTAGTTFTDTDEIAVNISGEDKRITGANLRESIPASTTQKGTVEMATDEEALAGTDETKFVNPKQLKDNSVQGLGSRTTLSNFSETTASGTATADGFLYGYAMSYRGFGTTGTIEISLSVGGTIVSGASVLAIGTDIKSGFSACIKNGETWQVTVHRLSNDARYSLYFCPLS